MNTLLYKPNLKEINKDYVAVFNAVDSTNWILISLIPKTSAYHINSLYLIFFIINIIFFSVLFFILYLFFNKRIFNPLKSLITNMNKNIEQKELELRQLQSQINPHFIYNTLESIHMMAEINEEVMNCKIIKMIIQPIIENSINHGLSKCTEADKIII